MPFVVYILINSNYQTYVGQTNNIMLRLERHNAGLVHSTVSGRPWYILFTEEYQTRSEAMKREKWLKSGIGREYIRAKVRSTIGPPSAD